MSARSQSGQVAVLVLGLALVVFAVSGVAVDGTRAFLYRRALQNAADASALAAAGELDRAAYYSSGGSKVVVHPVAAETQARRVLGVRGLDVQGDVRVGTGGVTVVLSGEVPTTFLGLVGIKSVPVGVVARAEPFAGR